MTLQGVTTGTQFSAALAILMTHTNTEFNPVNVQGEYGETLVFGSTDAEREALPPMVRVPWVPGRLAEEVNVGIPPALEREVRAFQEVVDGSARIYEKYKRSTSLEGAARLGLFTPDVNRVLDAQQKRLFVSLGFEPGGLEDVVEAQLRRVVRAIYHSHVIFSSPDELYKPEIALEGAAHVLIGQKAFLPLAALASEYSATLSVASLHKLREGRFYGRMPGWIQSLWDRGVRNRIASANNTAAHAWFVFAAQEDDGGIDDLARRIAYSRAAYSYYDRKDAGNLRPADCYTGLADLEMDSSPVRAAHHSLRAAWAATPVVLEGTWGLVRGVLETAETTFRTNGDADTADRIVPLISRVKGIRRPQC